MKPDPATRWEDQPLDWARDSGHAARLKAALAQRQKSQTRRRIAGGSAIVAVLVGGLIWFARPAPPSAAPAIAATAPTKAIVTAPERRTLPDGSLVELKAGAVITVGFAAGETGPRRVALKSGEAHFQVAKDATRPFLVDVGGVTFRAVGTAFTIQLTGQSAEMIVTEGTVAIDRAAAPSTSAASPEPATLVSAGSRAVVNLTALQTAPAVTSLTATEENEKLAWRVPRLEFNETPLWEVVSLINQHSASRIVLANAELGRVEISGALRADNIEPMLRMLEANYHIQVVRRPSGEIELKR